MGILVDNALEASPDDVPVRLSILSRDGHIIFEVRDQGSGMPPEVVRRAGEPFFTTKPPGEGMGLGLFLVRLVVEKLGGSCVWNLNLAKARARCWNCRDRIGDERHESHDRGR